MTESTEMLTALQLGCRGTGSKLGYTLLADLSLLVCSRTPLLSWGSAHTGLESEGPDFPGDKA